MSDPILAYETPVMGRPSGLRTATWIALLVLGILHSLVGLCVAGAVGVGGVSGSMPPDKTVLIVGIIAAIMTVFLGTGIAYIWTSWRIRKESRAATITALVVALINALLLSGVGVTGVVMYVSAGGFGNPGAIFGGLFYGIGGLTNGALAVMTILLLREKRQVP